MLSTLLNPSSPTDNPTSKPQSEQLDGTHDEYFGVDCLVLLFFFFGFAPFFLEGGLNGLSLNLLNGDFICPSLKPQPHKLHLDKTRKWKGMLFFSSSSLHSFFPLSNVNTKKEQKRTKKQTNCSSHPIPFHFIPSPFLPNSNLLQPPPPPPSQYVTN